MTNKIKSTLFLWVGLATGVSVYLGCSLIKPWYGYTALVRAPDLAIFSPEQIAKKAQMNLFGQSGGLSAASEGQAYLQFTYVRKKRAAGSAEPFLYDVAMDKESSLLELTAHATSLAAAKEFLATVVADLQAQFKKRVDDIETDVSNQIKIVEQQISSTEKILENSRSLGKKLGFSVQLLDIIKQLERDLFAMELNLAKLKSSITSEKLFNFSVLEQRPVDPFKPIFPRRGLFSVMAAILAGCLVYFLDAGTKRVLKQPSSIRREEPFKEVS